MIDDFSFSTLNDYCGEVSSTEDPILQALYRESHLKTTTGRMASGPFQGVFLQMISGMLVPRSILEIGTFTGYATICLARGLRADGVVHTIEVNPELRYISDKYFKLADLTSQIITYHGDAKEIIPTIDDMFDLVFIDAKKQDYLTYYEMVIDKVPSGGLIIADNVLWDGKVLDTSKDKTSQAIHDFNIHVKNDPRVANILVPLRDGLMMVRKI